MKDGKRNNMNIYKRNSNNTKNSDVIDIEYKGMYLLKKEYVIRNVK